MDMDIHNKLTIKSNIAMFGSIILVIFIIVCCWMAPVIAHWCNERTNGQGNEPENAIEMEQLGRENNVNA